MSGTTIPRDCQVFQIYIAASSGEEDKVWEIQCQTGVSLDMKDNKGRNAMSIAREYQDQRAIRTLEKLDVRATSVTDADAYTSAPPDETAEGPSPSEDDASDASVTSADNDLLPVLQVYNAAAFGSVDFLLNVIDAIGASVDYTNGEGINAARMATLKGDVVALSCLLDAGADVDEDVIELAVENDQMECLSLLSEHILI
ncbi:unnamed protein product [Lymnaea stagnalis]|uniref:Uncharacterized protein n=1 Tax=Lymnaea stagnalis TaxID=6523 RepID=A0AAV2GY90_LYMST